MFKSSLPPPDEWILLGSIIFRKEDIKSVSVRTNIPTDEFLSIYVETSAGISKIFSFDTKDEALEKLYEIMKELCQK